MINWDDDQAAIAWSRFTTQFDQSKRLEAYTKALHTPENGAQASLKQLLDERWLDTAIGKQLDGAGDILGQPRRITDVVAYRFFGFRDQPNAGGFGQAPFRRAGQPLTQGTTILDDINYRRLLKWKRLVNQGHGTASEISESLRVLFNATAVSVTDSGNASIYIIVNKVPDDEDIFLKNILKWVPKAGGIRVTYDLVDFDEWLTWDNDQVTFDNDQITWDAIGL